MSEPLDRDERVGMHGVDPEAVLRALLQVDPESEPVAEDDERTDEGKILGDEDRERE